MDGLLSQLRDIRGVGDVAWWPLAPGWWSLAFLLVGLCLGFFLYRYYRERKLRHWKEEARRLFVDLRAESDSKKKVAALSALLRRLAIRRYGREECAGLEGEGWLSWLAKHDPHGFDWMEEGRALIDFAYAPDNIAASHDVEILIKAAERWGR